MKILLTGYKGFIGSHVYNHLKNLDFDVDGFDRPDELKDFKTDKIYDVVIHLAAYAALRDSKKNPNKFWQNNVEDTKPIFEYCRKNNIRLLYASSAGAHGWWENPYAMTKKANELMAPPNSVGMRFFNVWAEENSRDDMLYRMLQENTATYLTTHRRDWIHVHDVTTAICHLIPAKFRGILDIGTGKNHSVIDLAKKLGRGDLPIKEVSGEPETLCADITELTKLGWQPTIDIMS